MSQFKPMLAAIAPADLSKLCYPLLASPKLDGIRCVIRGGKALSRTLKPIPNHFIREWLESVCPDGLDGELLLPNWTEPLGEVTSVVMSHDGEPDFVYAVFDFEGINLDENGISQDFNDRISYVEDLCSSKLKLSARCRAVPHVWVRNVEELQAFVEANLAAGYEGTMVRHPSGHYKFGRSTVKEGLLLKIKPYVDDDAIVIGFKEEMANTNEGIRNDVGALKRSSAKFGKIGKGRVGALICRMADGTEVDVAGFTDQQKGEMWDRQERYLGRSLKFKHLPPPTGRQPGQACRHPTFLCWRED